MALSLVARRAVLGAWLAGCAAAPAAVPVAKSSSSQAGTTTEVSVTRDGKTPPNPSCVRYCERLAQCHGAVAFLDPALSSEDVLVRCEADEGRCYRPTTEADCCATLGDCQDFARCQAQSRNVPSDCQQGTRGPLAAASSGR